MKIERDIVFLDLETTGLDLVNDEIIEIAILKYTKDGQTIQKHKRFKPSVPIKPDAEEVHKISMKDLENELPFSRFAKAIFDFIKDCDICTYNPYNLDLPILIKEFERCGLNLDYSKINILDPYTVFVRNESRDLKAAFKFYCKKEVDESRLHDALYDTELLFDVFKAQLDYYNYKTDVKSLEELSDFGRYDKKLVDINRMFTLDKNGEYVYNKGKHKGDLVINHPDHLDWIVNKSDLPNNTKIIANAMLEAIKLIK